MEKHEKTGLATAGLVIGIIGVTFSFIPIINNGAFFLGILAIIFAIVSFVKKAGKGKAIAALILGVLSIIITIGMQNLFVKELDNAFDEAFADKTEEILKKEADITLGKFEIKKDEFGIEETKLVVTLKNKSNKKQSFSVKIEAKDSAGNRIETDDAYFDTVSAGQTVSSEAFTFVTSEKVSALKNATFTIIEVSAY